MSAATDRWAAQPGPHKVLTVVRELLQERRTGNGVTVRVDLTAAERTQLARYLGLTWDTSGQPVTLGRLRAALTRAGDDLLDLLTRTGGPIEDVRGRREQAVAHTAATIDAAYTDLGTAGLPDHAVQLARTRRWLGTDPGTATRRSDDLQRLWHVLPGTGRPLAEIANTLYADPHRLDRDTDLGRIAARLLAATTATADNAVSAADTALIATRWRHVWAAHGISCDEVSATVLVLNLPLTGKAPAAPIAGAAAAHGEPVWLTSRSLRGDWRPAPELTVVRVCENPAVAEAAAEQLGTTCLPLVCIYGRPSSAAWTLLRGLAAAGVHLRVTADRDAAGRGFLAEMLALPGATEWLPEADGLYEEARLQALITDLTPARHAGFGEPASPHHQ
ncbi:TIGR02679 domain-containing protein [Actinoplanes sp. NEAU-A12]|uniref:TIGR02679 domain-containing protein n=1 Tax=Actinoplanes sandaracinus TaxID=3045177 RepID=A0ABT6WWM8_9ACTN|nr:TIGR02679 domain-containing protein [Actinoplanes sandaracinus]MDI6104153.1 TIGR02679 domain-containing protein [Actinoplanes sandaracinus]